MSAEISSGQPTGTGVADPLGEGSTPATISLSVSSTTVNSCQPLNITWTVLNGSADLDISMLTISYSNAGVSQVNGETTYNPPLLEEILWNTPVSRLYWTWPAVFLQNPGNYVITATSNVSPSPAIERSSPFLVNVEDTSCFMPEGSESSSTTPLATPSDTPSAPSNSPSEYSTASAKKTNVGAIVGGTVTAVVLVGLLAAWLLFRRRRNRNSKVVDSSQVLKKGHRKWGGLSSIDKLQQGEIPVVIPANSPYATQSIKRNRSQSTGRAMTEEEMEKGYENDIFPVDANALAEMPALNASRESRRYSSDALSAMLRQNSGLAAFNEQYGNRNMGAGGVASPIVSTTTATAGGGDDPFSDAAFMARAKRVSALSVPSTARTPSRVSDISNRGPPSPLPQSQPPSQPNTMSRNGSASVGRPNRKPVPQYADDSFELTNTSKSSPTTPSPLSPQSRQGHGHGTNPSYGDLSTTASTNHLAESYDSVSPWLERVPVANRNIGLAGQTDGPVHYLMPDLPPPPRD